ncbi:MAG: hypothetical protein NC127_06785 [Muribaculum sp.]|nr:hypothetical protein [Muribaculum sp.]
MKQDSDILNQLNRRSGMTVPNGYFEDFASRMMQNLPEKEIRSEERILPRTLWQRVRPYAYMAAMFCGIWLMMWIFNDISGRSSYDDMTKNPVIASVLASDQIYDYCDTEVDEYELLNELYDQGFTLASYK